MRIDHVVLAVRDLDAAGERILESVGLGSLPGGRHAAWGTGNRIVPLGTDYVELLAVVDPDIARGTVLGRIVTSAPDGRPIAWCVATSDLQRTAQRLGLPVLEGSRERPDGQVLRWRSAGLEEALAHPSLPFFIEWLVPDDLHPGRTRAPHRVTPKGITWIELGGDEGDLREWLGGERLPVRVAAGREGIRAVGISTAEGVAVLE